MTNQKSGTGSGAAASQSSSAADCQPCAVPAFCRSNYYTGKLLTERDFSGEQQYHSDKLRLHYMGLHGWGLVCGLTVEPHPYCPQLRIVVDPGFGIDDCGREVRVLKPTELALPLPDTTATPKQPCPPDPTTGTSAPPSDTATTTATAVPAPPAQAAPAAVVAPPVLYVCVRYCENQVEFTPAPFDDCGCNSIGQQPNRICETFEFKIFQGEPEFMKCVREHSQCCEEDVCIDIYKRVLKPCRKPGCVHWLPLATIKGFTPGQAVTVEQMKGMIDNWTVRPLLPSTRMLDHLIQCILNRLPPQPLTVIDKFNWDHAQLYTCRQFLSEYTEQPDHTGGFQIVFSAPVHADGVSGESFQATIAFLPDDPTLPTTLEVAPAKVSLAPDNTSCWLRIDPNYAQNRLNGKNFDVFIRLRCDVIVDQKGHPVDGDLLARLNEDTYAVDAPTGDGIPGGLFESWIQVRMSGKKNL
ncbi:MAG: hypothetical protein ACLQKA_01685 [Bryobacteraceae bacterium]